MISEAKRGLIRISSNYIRVITVVVLGLVSVRLLLWGTGEDGWALIALLGSTISLAAMLQEVVGASLIRELGTALHSGDDSFRPVYNTSLCLSAGLAVLTAALFGTLALLVPVLDIPDELHGAARWLIGCRGIETATFVLLAPPFNMYKVTERMAAYNVWLILNRVGYVAAAVLVITLHLEPDTARAVTIFAVSSSALAISTVVAATVMIVVADRRLRPRLSLANRRDARSVLSIGGWNIAALTATNLHHRISPIVMNLAFGLSGNLILGLAIQLTVSVRRLAVGVTDGVDAVSARLSTTRAGGAVRALLLHSTRLHALVAFPILVGIVLLADPVLRLWVGARINDPAAIPQTVTLVRIMSIGMTVRAVSDGWVRIFYGAGHVSSYALYILLGGVLNPILAVALLAVLPGSVRYTAVAWSFSAVLACIHGVVVPLIGARSLDIPAGELFRPLWRPGVIALLPAPLLLPALGGGAQRPVLIIALVVAYAVIYAALAWLVVVDRDERRRVTRAVLRTVPRRT